MSPSFSNERHLKNYSIETDLYSGVGQAVQDHCRMAGLTCAGIVIATYRVDFGLIPASMHVRKVWHGNTREDVHRSILSRSNLLLIPYIGQLTSDLDLLYNTARKGRRVVFKCDMSIETGEEHGGLLSPIRTVPWGSYKDYSNYGAIIAVMGNTETERPGIYQVARTWLSRVFS